MIDTGATDVSIPGDVVLTLVRTGTVAATDFTGQRTYVLADGSKLPSLQFTLRQLRVGNEVIRNVAANVAPVTSRYPLLGQSFLSRLPPWSIDYRRHVLVLNAPFNEPARPAHPVAVPSPAPPQVTAVPQGTPTHQNPFGSHGRWASTTSPGAGGEIYLTDIAMIPDGIMVGKVLFTGSPCASWTNFSGRLTGQSAVLSMNMGRCGLTIATLQQAPTGGRVLTARNTRMRVLWKWGDRLDEPPRPCPPRSWAPRYSTADLVPASKIPVVKHPPRWAAFEADCVEKVPR